MDTNGLLYTKISEAFNVHQTSILFKVDGDKHRDLHGPQYVG